MIAYAINSKAQTLRQEIRTFWVGPSLSLYEQLSLTSFVQAGAKVQLFTYDPGLVVPDGVERIDANEILPGSVHGFRGPTGHLSFALHSDLFRYEAIHRSGGWYADLDVVFIGALLPDDPIYLAHETEQLVNGAILRFPPNHHFIAKAISEARRLLPETSASTGRAARVLIGPTLITKLIKDFAMESVVRPRSLAYEIGTDEVKAFFDPASCERLKDRLANSDFTHLWNGHWALFPKTFGPPKGSYLDFLFSRAGIVIPDRARLAYSTVLDWFRAQRLVAVCKHRLREDLLPPDAVERIVKPALPPAKDETSPPRPTRSTQSASLAKNPQVIQTFWQGGPVGPYHLLCLRSFVDRGHQVELFTYNPRLRLPSWIERRSAAEILPPDQVIRSLPDRTAIDKNLFRYALLQKRGGWWIDPDVVLLQSDLPEQPIFFAGQNGFGLTSTSLLRFPREHDIVVSGLSQALAARRAGRGGQRSGSPLLTDIIRKSDHRTALESGEMLGPVSWFDVLALFDPSRRESLAERCESALVLQLQFEVWHRAGIPQNLGPPKGSMLDSLLERHDVFASFPAEMSFSQIKRWTDNMYGAMRV